MSSRGAGDQRVVVITGGASGMGAASATLFREQGDHVTIIDLQPGTSPGTLVGDVADSAFCDNAIAAVVEQYGRIDVLVNAAGTIHRADATGTSDADWDRVMSVNVNGTFFMSRAAIRHMASERSGAIINFGSIWGGVGAARVTAYCVSKGAVHQLTRAMALDHADGGIRINAVAPGEVNTPMLASQRETPPSPLDLELMAKATIPVQRLAEPVEIAEMVVFLASDRASYITGAIIPIDGGYTAR